MICDKAEVLVYLRKADTSVSGADDALLDLIHPLAESAIHNYLQNDCNYQQHVEYLPVGTPNIEREYPLENYRKSGERFVCDSGQTGRESLKLTHTPVTLTGLKVWEDFDANAGQASGAFGSDTELTIGTDFFLDVEGNSDLSTTGLLYRLGAWPTEPRCVKIQYYGGWSALQLTGPRAGSLKLAALRQIAFEFTAALQAKSSSGPKIREKIGKYEYELDSGVAKYLAGMSVGELLPNVKSLLQPFRSYVYL